MQCDPDSSTIVLQSRRNPSPTSLNNFLVFDYPPLTMKLHFEVSKSVFGKDMVKVECGTGILLVMRQTDIIQGFSMEYIEKVSAYTKIKRLTTQISFSKL